MKLFKLFLGFILIYLLWTNFSKISEMSLLTKHIQCLFQQQTQQELIKVYK